MKTGLGMLGSVDDDDDGGEEEEEETRMLEGLISACVQDLSCIHCRLVRRASAMLGKTAASFSARLASSSVLSVFWIQPSSVSSMAWRRMDPVRVSRP